jgi:hypothetical protein
MKYYRVFITPDFVPFDIAGLSEWMEKSVSRLTCLIDMGLAAFDSVYGPVGIFPDEFVFRAEHCRQYRQCTICSLQVTDTYSGVPLKIVATLALEELDQI